MKTIFTKILTISAFTITANFTIKAPTMAQGVTFACALNQHGDPTTVARSAQGDIPIITWKTEKGGGFTARKKLEKSNLLTF